MREIKFRGLTLNGEWRVGNLSILTKKFNGVEAGSYISNSGGAPFAYAVRPETVGQFTGLKDKNGVEIFEGDVVMSYANLAGGENKIMSVVFDDGCFILKKSLPYNTFRFLYSNPLEVIGNIHENPELLEAK